MKRLGIMLLVVAFMFGGLFAFGSVNQFEVETGLTVDAVMLPAEKTVEAVGCSFVNMTYAEFAIGTFYNSNETKNHFGYTMPYYLLGTFIMEMGVNPVNGNGGVTDRLKYPFCTCETM